MQADSEERMEAEMQTSAFVRSVNEQTSLQNARSCNIQTSEIEMKSAKFQAFDKDRTDMCVQTDPTLLAKPIPTKHMNMNVQTERYKDITKNDWAESTLFMRALRDEATKRGIATSVYHTSDEGETSWDSDRAYSILTPKALPIVAEKPESEHHQMNAQDPDTDIMTVEEKDAYSNCALGFLKSYKT
jgi:hypothetical protein